MTLPLRDHDMRDISDLQEHIGVGKRGIRGIDSAANLLTINKLIWISKTVLLAEAAGVELIT
jgi:hypothetical protein